MVLRKVVSNDGQVVVDEDNPISINPRYTYNLILRILILGILIILL
jgi:hypothetical protein